MAFTATIVSITPIGSENGTGVIYQTVVNFADSVSGFATTKTYNFSVATTQTTAVNIITADGTLMKAAIAGAGTLQQKIGSVLTI